MTIRTLIVDDEQPARDRLRQLLAGHPDVEVVGEAEDGVQAIEAVAALAPSLVLLDIQMPGCSGLEVASSLAHPRPAIVFCTAFDQYAVDAFELQAMDYLLKPVTRARLQAALDRLRAGGPTRTEDRAVDQLSHAPGLAPTRFLARKGSRYRVVPASEVTAFSFDEGLTRLHTTTEQLWMQPTLAALGRRLPPEAFAQISRTVVVKLDAIREARPMSDGTGQITLEGGATFAVSRRRWRILMEKLGG
ncbi:MAG: LytTR family DNA-binding domain-containing protein [Vicinamibacterales bacterium]|nr:LytTR family DNA-binding domain-containing protein [Vicinamibacterales bacterium]